MIRKRIIDSLKWLSSMNILKQIVQIVTIMVYAHYLSPSDFGLFAIIMVVVSIANLFNNFGTHSAIIHFDFDIDTNHFLSTIFYINIFIGISLCLILIMTSSVIAEFYHEDGVADMLIVMSCSFILTSLSNVHRALLEKKMEFKLISIIDFITTIGASMIGLLLVVFFNYGIYGLIVQNIFGLFMASVLIWNLNKWKPSFVFSFSVLQKIFSFMRNITLFNIINAMGRNMDQILIGKFLSSNYLGVYSMAFKIVVFPIQNISSIFSVVMFPAFSEIKNNNKEIRLIYLKIIFAISLLFLPILMGLSSLSDLFINIFLGIQWGEMVSILPFIAMGSFFQALLGTVGAILLAKGRDDLLLKLSFFNSLVFIVFILFGLQFGLMGVAIAYCISFMFLVVPNFIVSWSLIDLKFKTGFDKIFPVFIISSSMTFMVFFFKNLLFNYLQNDVIILILSFLFGIFIYLIGLKFKYKKISRLFNQLTTNA